MTRCVSVCNYSPERRGKAQLSSAQPSSAPPLKVTHLNVSLQATVVKVTAEVFKAAVPSAINHV